jgi:hypothetical protein
MVAETCGMATPAFTAALHCITFPWEVPSGTIVVEYSHGRWRVITRDRAVATFGSREAAMTHARQIAALFIPLWKIVERDPPEADAIAC